MSSSGYPKVVVHDISEWDEKPHVSHYGKRLKDVYENPKAAGDYYYFKQSDQRYPWEFWSEVIASRLAAMFNIPCAVYDPAIITDHSENEDLWGCLSKLLNGPHEEFKHGQEFLLQRNPEFDITKGAHHSYQAIMEVFDDENLTEKDIQLFHRMLVFDAFIGNRDRHQQNWAIIYSMGRLIADPNSYKGKAFLFQ